MSAIFISHSSRDGLASAEINQWLIAEGHRAIFLDFDPEAGIPAGRNWERELYQQLRSCRAVIALCSESSMASRWCFAEITQARSLGKALIPVKVDGCELDGVLAGKQAIDLAADREEDFKRLRRGLLAAGLDPADAFDWDATRPPYPGLLAFQERDAAIFFGRDNEIGAGLDLVNRLHRLGSADMAMVVGASGSGKSSLVRAGIVPRLRRDKERWLVVGPFRPRNDPVAELAEVWSRAFVSAGAARDQSSIGKQLREALSNPLRANPLVQMADDLRRVADRPDAKVLLAVDQFEELLGSASSEVSAGVLAMLRTGCRAPGFPIVILGTMRADFLGAFQNHPALADVRCELQQVAAMSADDVTKIIEEPAKVAGLELESGLATAMIAESTTGDALPLLAFTLRELWSQFGKDGLLELREYHQLGGIHGAVAQVADELFDAQDLTPEQQQELRHAFLSLVHLTEDDRLVRRVAKWTDIAPPVHEILERFVDARLLVADSTGDARTVEVAHEALFRSWRRLSAWLTQSAQAMQLRREIEQASAGWVGNGRQPEDLWRGTRLARAAELTEAGDLPLGEVDTEFINDSVQAEAAEIARAGRRRRRNLQTAIGLAVVGALLAAVATVFYVQARKESNRAEHQARRSSALTLAAQASGLSSENPALALALAAEASRTTTPALPQASAALFEARSAFGQRNGQQIGEPLEGHIGSVTSVAFSPDGRLMASGGREGTVRLWDSRDGSPVGDPLERHSGPVYGVAFSPDGRLLASAGDDGQVWLWDPRDGSPVRPLDGGDGVVLGVAFSPDGTLAAATLDGTVRLWDLSGDTPTSKPLEGHDRWVDDVAFSPDGRTLASAGVDGTVRLWDLSTNGQASETITPHDGEGVEGVAFSLDGRLLASAGVDGTVRLSSLSTRRPTGEPLRGHTGTVWGVAFSRDGKLASAGADGTVRLWDPRSGVQVGEPLRGHTGRVLWVAFSREGRLASAGTDETVRLWDPRQGSPVGELLVDYDDAVFDVAFSADGILATAGADGTVRLWDPEGNPVGELRGGHDKAVLGVAFSSDGRWLATAGEDGRVWLWDWREGSRFRELSGARDDAMNAVAFSPDGMLAAAGDDGIVRLWDPGEENPVGDLLEGHRAAVLGLAFSPDGQQLASAGEDGKVRLWDPKSGGSVGEPIPGDIEFVLAVAFSPDGRLIASAGTDQMVRLWNPPSGRPVGEPFEGHDDAVTEVVFGPDGMLASAGRDGSVRLWDAREGQPIGEPLEDIDGAAEVQGLAFSPDGKLLVSAHIDGKVLVWDAPWDVDVACDLAAPYVTAEQMADYLPPEQAPMGCDLNPQPPSES